MKYFCRTCGKKLSEPLKKINGISYCPSCFTFNTLCNFNAIPEEQDYIICPKCGFMYYSVAEHLSIEEYNMCQSCLVK